MPNRSIKRKMHELKLRGIIGGLPLLFGDLCAIAYDAMYKGSNAETWRTRGKHGE